MDRCDVRFDVAMAHLTRDRHTMVAVINKVSVTNLKEIDRRQTYLVFGETLDPCPPLCVAITSRQEVASKVFVTAHAPDDRIQRNVLENAPVPTNAPHLFSDFFKGKKIRRFTGQ